MKKGVVIIIFLLVSQLVAQSQTTQKKPTQTKPASGSTSASSGLKASLERGKVVYTASCLVCHQADGGGVPRMNPPLIKTKWVLGDKKDLITVMLKGMNEPIEIEDEEYHNPMPPHKELSDQQIADVLTYVRNNFGNKASAVSSGEVKAVRAKVK
jgi:mono/diheme cytochrome c family protein